VAQFYFLSVVANLAASLVLGGEYFAEKMPLLKCFMDLMSRRSARIALGVSAFAIGVLKLFIMSPGERVPVVGDLLPAVMGIGLGALLIAQINPDKVERAAESIRKISRTGLTYRVPVAIAGIVTATLHFLFPGLLLL